MSDSFAKLSAVNSSPGKSILIIDDNSDGADLIAEVLSMHGYVVATAYGGRQGIEVARSFRPDLILLDLGMPDIDGFGVIAALTLLPDLRRTAFVAYTAWSDVAIRHRTELAGFDAHLPKPADLATLLRTVEETNRG